MFNIVIKYWRWCLLLVPSILSHPDCLGALAPSCPISLLNKHLNYLHMARHALNEFRHLNLSRNLGLTSTSRQVGLNPLRIKWYEALSPRSIILCLFLIYRLVSKLSYIQTCVKDLTHWGHLFKSPSSNPLHSLAPMRFMSATKPGVKPGPTLKMQPNPP